MVGYQEPDQLKFFLLQLAETGHDETLRHLPLPCLDNLVTNDGDEWHNTGVEPSDAQRAGHR